MLPWTRALRRLGWLLLLVGGAPFLWAQRIPHVGYAYPAGMQQGTTADIVVGGQYLNGAGEVYVSGTGVTARVTGYDRPMPQKRVNELRDKLKDVRTQMTKARKEGRFKSPGEAMQLFMRLAGEQGITLEELKKAADYRARQQDPKRQLNAQIAESVTVSITAEPNAAPGVRDLRVRTRSGLSNPVRFCIDQLPETREAGPKQEFTWESLASLGGARMQRNEPPVPVTSVRLPAVVNGQILPGEADQFRFKARKGQSLVAAVSARSLIPYLADAVPGWFQATVALYDSKGEEVAYADDFRFHPDPVLHFEIPRDGDYTLEIKDSIYRGREDFVYRIALGELPFITGIFPLGCRAGASASVDLMGWNLPVRQLTVQPRADQSEAIEVGLEREGRFSNRVPFAVGSLPEVMENEPNQVGASAQTVTTPLIINGRIDQAGDWDVFRFQGKAGERVAAEVFARRLGSPLDSILKLTDGAGLELALNDDHEDKASGLTTHHADSRLEAMLPADGDYFLSLGDTQNRGGEAYGYRLQIGPALPDFQLRVVPSSVSVRAGSSVPLTVHVLRSSGFTNDIELAFTEAPRGLSLRNTHLSSETNRFQVLLKASDAMLKQPCSVHLEGRALLGGSELVRSAVPADDLMQAFIYRHLVPAAELQVAVIGRSPSKPSSSPAAARQTAKTKSPNTK